MNKKNKLKFFDFLAWGIIIVLILFFLILILGAISGIELIGTLVGILGIIFFVLSILFWFSMIIICYKTDRVGYLVVLILLFGVVVAHLFYFKVYRKTLKK